MNKKKFTQVARNVIDLEIKGLQKLKRKKKEYLLFYSVILKI